MTTYKRGGVKIFENFKLSYVIDAQTFGEIKVWRNDSNDLFISQGDGEVAVSMQELQALMFVLRKMNKTYG